MGRKQESSYQQQPASLVSKVPGQSRSVWKTQFTFTSRMSMEFFVEAIVNWEERLKWDQGFSYGETLKSFQDCNITQSKTKQILTVSPREFIDVSACEISADRRSMIWYFAAATPEIFPDMPPIGRGMVRGDVQVGSGIRATILSPAEDGKNLWQIEVVAEADPKGWLPVSVINNAFTLQLSDNYKFMVKYFGNI